MLYNSLRRHCTCTTNQKDINVGVVKKMGVVKQNGCDFSKIDVDRQNIPHVLLYTSLCPIKKAWSKGRGHTSLCFIKKGVVKRAWLALVTQVFVALKGEIL